MTSLHALAAPFHRCPFSLFLSFLRTHTHTHTYTHSLLLHLKHFRRETHLSERPSRACWRGSSCRKGRENAIADHIQHAARLRVIFHVIDPCACACACALSSASLSLCFPPVRVVIRASFSRPLPRSLRLVVGFWVISLHARPTLLRHPLVYFLFATPRALSWCALSLRLSPFPLLFPFFCSCCAHAFEFIRSRARSFKKRWSCGSQRLCLCAHLLTSLSLSLCEALCVWFSFRMVCILALETVLVETLLRCRCCCDLIVFLLLV